MFLRHRTTDQTCQPRSPMRVFAATAVALALAATACGSSTTTVDGAAVSAPANSGDAAPTTTFESTQAAPTVEAAAVPAPTQIPDPSLPSEFVVSMAGPGVSVADGYVAQRSVDCSDELDTRQNLFDFALPAGWNNDIGNWSGSDTSTTYEASLSREVTDDVNILNQEFLLIQIAGYVNHGTSIFGGPTETPEIPLRTQWFDEDELNPLTVIGEATVGGTAVPVYHSQTQDIEDQYGQFGGDIAVWQVTGTAATWPVPEATKPGRLDYRILVATDYTRTDLPADFRIDEAQALAIIESVQASACLRPNLIERAANHWEPYILE